MTYGEFLEKVIDEAWEDFLFYVINMCTEPASRAVLRVPIQEQAAAGANGLPIPSPTADEITQVLQKMEHDGLIEWVEGKGYQTTTLGEAVYAGREYRKERGAWRT